MSEQSIIRWMQASSCFGRETCPAPPCACARSLNDLLGAEQDAEIARFRRETAEVVDALKAIANIGEWPNFNKQTIHPIHRTAAFRAVEIAINAIVDRSERASMRSAAEKGDLPSVNWNDGKPYSYCPECGRREPI